MFTGYGGLDMAVGGDVVWYSEIEPAACKILAEHYPGVTNLGDITVVDWSTVEPVDVITGGYPCQPFSTAGMRRGKNDDRHLWPYVRDAISTLRPSLAVLENVRGHLSMGLADVIGDLAGVGYDARWGLVRASDAGAPHGRARVFIVAYPDGKGLQGLSDRSSEAQARINGHTEQGIGPSFWGQYESAITRWESITRPAPQPTVHRTDRERINTRFVEWMMGLPEGHVTGRGLSAAQELKMLGNGVCPQQAALALRLLGAA